MIGEYTCPFLHNSGDVCGRSCMRPEGCCYHYKAKQRIICIKCDKVTGSQSGLCTEHVKSYNASQHYNKYLKKHKRKLTECQYCKSLNIGEERFGHNQAGCNRRKKDMILFYDQCVPPVYLLHSWLISGDFYENSGHERQ